MDEQQARRELRAALKRRRLQQQFALGLLGVVFLGSLIAAGVSYAQEGAFRGEQLLPLIYGAMFLLMWRITRRMDASGALVACRVVHPYGVGGRGLRIRLPNGALLDASLADDKGAVLNAGDQVWFANPRAGQRLIGVAWNRFQQRGEPVVSVTPARLVVPAGAVPSVFGPDGVQDALGSGAGSRPGSVAGSGAGSPPGSLSGAPSGSVAGARPGQPPRPLAIRPLGPPPLPCPDGIDESQARAALRSADGRRAVTPPDVPLEIVTIDSPPPSAYAPRRADITIRRADGNRLTWPVTMERWPDRGSTAWATRGEAGESIRLVAPTSAGDVVVIDPLAPALAGADLAGADIAGGVPRSARVSEPPTHRPAPPREDAERLLRGYRPRGPFAAGRAIDPTEPILPVTTAFEVRTIRHPSGEAVYDRWVDHHEFTLPDGSVYSWDWQGPVWVPKGSVIWCTDPASDRQVGCAIARQHVEPGGIEVIWAKEGSVELVRGAHPGGRRPILDAAVIAPLDVTAGTGLTEDEVRLILRQRAAGLRRRRVGLLLGTLGLAWWSLRRRIGLYDDAAQGPLAVVEIGPATPYGLRVRGPDGLLYSWPARSTSTLTAMANAATAAPGDRVWATPIAAGARVLIVGQRDGTPFVIEPGRPADPPWSTEG